MKSRKITEADIAEMKISNLPTRPTSPQSFGGKGYTAADMKAAFDKASDGALKSAADYFCCAYRSLANSYRDALNNLEQNTGETYDSLYIVGGGAKNQFLNRLTEEATGKKVIALPIEATALGNLKVQLEA